MIDLHHHSNHSDGKATVEELLKKAIETGIAVMSITDHDTLAGQEKASFVANLMGIKYIHGIELSTQFDNKSVHLLGYFAKLPSKNARSKLDKYLLNLQVKRMRAKRECKSEEISMPIKDALEFIKSQNGFAILPHPILYYDRLDYLLPLVDGIEAVYPSHSEYFISEMVGEAESRGLFVTSGSDLHGTIRSKEFDLILAKYGEFTNGFIEKFFGRLIP
ncbi:PHP domain-containing protein [Paenibacillus polymyxa]|uniref:PHP domain-containing protein n=1 Tax=Paenibacillus polymyxa TaxID=1406 RepID=UPI001BEC66D7|nr:PHP domain-containing protein [Paenibacillus polymyxa]MBT2282963.1 PHP domain-containing protein [Paenibacillus polymyxa]